MAPEELTGQLHATTRPAHLLIVTRAMWLRHERLGQVLSASAVYSRRQDYSVDELEADFQYSPSNLIMIFALRMASNAAGIVCL